MMVGFLLALLVLVAGYMYWRDQKFQKTPLKNLLSDDMKKELNLPHPDNPFPEHVADPKTANAASTSILRLQNSEQNNIPNE